MKAPRLTYELLTPQERRRAVALFALMLVGMVLETLGIGAVLPAVGLLLKDNVAAEYPRLAPILHWLGDPSPARLVVIGMTTLVALFVLKTIFLIILQWRQTKFSFAVQASLSQRLFRTYLRQPYAFHLQRNSAQLIGNAVTEVNQFTFNVLLPSLLVVTEGLVMLGVCALLVYVEPVGALLVVVVLGSASFAFYWLTRRRIARWGAERQHHEGLRLQHLQQGLGGAKDVKLLGREQEFIDQYERHNSRAAHVGHMQATLVQLPRLWLELLGVIGLAILVIAMVSRGRDAGAIIPALGLFAVAAFRLMPSANRMLGAVQSLRYGGAVVDLLHREIHLSPVAAREETPIAKLGESVEVRDVFFTYPGAPTPALSGVSISIRKGETIGVIGASGSGKSTLVDVVLGLFTPDRGQVLVDGTDIQPSLRSWQNHVGYVPQSVFLTDDTLRRNVAFGIPDSEIDDVAVWRALRSAQLEDFAKTLPEGLLTFVGERGVRISGGQRQRIGIARALYHDPDVLVLDEATSALDTVTEKGVMDAVAALHGSKTILIVAHRMSTVAQCERLYRLERGRVVESGHPSQMLGVGQAV